MLSSHDAPRMGEKKGVGGKGQNERDQSNKREENVCVYLKTTY